LSLTVAGAQQPKAIRPANIHYRLTNTDPNNSDLTNNKGSPMLRLTTVRLTSDGRLLGFDTGDWSMLLGGFVLAGLLTLFV
jgi:hypothetical protein